MKRMVILPKWRGFCDKRINFPLNYLDPSIDNPADRAERQHGPRHNPNTTLRIACHLRSGQVA